MTHLNPCPFCGERAELDVRRQYRNISTGALESAVTITCTACPAEMTVCRADVSDITADHVALMWNDRISTAQAQREAAAYRWAYGYLQDRMRSLERHEWAGDCDGEIEARTAPEEPTP